MLESILPKLIAFKAIMNIRNIDLKKAFEQKKMKEKAEMKGIPWSEAKKDPRFMTDAQIFAKKLSDENLGENPTNTSCLSEQQVADDIIVKEREIYGRYWIWEGYFNYKNQAQWLECAEKLK